MTKKIKAFLIFTIAVAFSANVHAGDKTQITDFFDAEAQMKISCGITDDAGMAKRIGALALTVVGHPGLTAKQFMGGVHGVYGIWEIVKEETADSLRDQTKQKMADWPNCYSAIGTYLNYQNLGIIANDTIARAFSNDEVRYNHSYVPASLEQQKLYADCTTVTDKKRMDDLDAQIKAYNEAHKSDDDEKVQNDKAPEDGRQVMGEIILQQAEARAGYKLIYSAWAMNDLYNTAIQKALIAKDPKTCEDVKVVDDSTMKTFIVADTTIRQRLKKVGYTIPYK